MKTISIRQIVKNAYAKETAFPAFNIPYLPYEAELGAVVGHEDGPHPPYEELFNSRKGFTYPPGV
jgi:fructose/tagatose bisphosphate aldolase